MNKCKNCGKPLHDIFCSHCGQKANIERITFNYLWHEIFHFFSHIEKGFVFTSLKMIFEPGRTVRNFIDGKRRSYKPPISYFLIWTTIYILFLYWLEKVFGENVVIDYKNYFGPAATTKYAISHLSWVLTLVIPFQALYLYLLVTRIKYNYFESMAATIYSLGTVILFQFIFAMLALFIHFSISTSVDLRFSDSFKIIYLLWFIVNLIKTFPVKYKFIRGLLILVLSFGTFTLWRLYGFPAFISWFK
jgi:hypothetical protein